MMFERNGELNLLTSCHVDDTQIAGYKQHQLIHQWTLIKIHDQGYGNDDMAPRHQICMGERLIWTKSNSYAQ